ncbi:MAG: hypothetical protein MJ231_03130, partial [bacterium]|nr:hypothetical protein [bacterium]
IRNSEEYAKEILDKKLLELAQNPSKYEKTMEKLGKIISDMEIKLHGNSEVESKMADLINAIEDNYNIFAKRLNNVGGFDSTINQAVKEHSDDLFTTLRRSGSVREDVFRFLDGTRETSNKLQGIDYVKENARNAGSSKHNVVTRIVDRYSGAKNSMHRILHTMDVYKRSEDPLKFVNSTYDRFTKEYSEQVAKAGKEILLSGTSAEHTLKHGISNAEFYQDVMRTTWAGDEANVFGKGTISESTEHILEKFDGLKDGKVKTRFQEYIQRFRNLIGNNNIDFTKPNHVLNPEQVQAYEKDAITRLSKFNEVAKTPVDFLRDAAGRRYGTQKWLRIIGGIFAGTVAIATLAQFTFGKINNPNNIRKEGK